MSIRKLLNILNKNRHKEENNNELTIALSNNLEKNLIELENDLGKSSDIVIRRIVIGKENPLAAAIVYTDGLVDISEINRFLKALMTRFPEKKPNKPTIELIKEEVLNVGDVKEFTSKADIINGILTGSTAILLDNSKAALVANTKGFAKRAISEPENQLVMRGPRQGFIENITTNTAMIRKIIPSSKLRVEQMKVGTLSETTVGIIYIEGIADKKIVNEVKERIKRIKTDSILGTGYIEELIQDNPTTLWPTVAYTERPDTASGNLLEGKILIIVDGTPFVLIVPTTFFMLFQSADDYFLKWHIASFMRLLRFVTFIFSMTLPSLYVATITYHPELIPTTLLISLSAQREGVPFPAFIEALLMELTFEVLREAGVRMPRAVGQAVAIVGALVLGTAAVEAGIVSPAMVIIVSMTAISSFTAPYIDLANTARIVRFAWLIFSSILGLFGTLFGLMLLIIHLSSLRSFGIPYLSGLAPFNVSDQKDILVRAPRYLMNKRPKLFAKDNPIRQEKIIPGPKRNRKR